MQGKSASNSLGVNSVSVSEDHVSDDLDKRRAEFVEPEIEVDDEPTLPR